MYVKKRYISPLLLLLFISSILIYIADLSKVFKNKYVLAFWETKGELLRLKLRKIVYLFNSEIEK